MNRRDLLRGLLALPLAPLAAKFLPRAFPKGIPLRIDDHFECSEVNVDLASGSDQTSIWFVNWGENHAVWQVDEVQRRASRNWLKERVNGH